MNAKFLKDTAERAITAFLTAYLGVWVADGADFDALVKTDNLKVGATALALSVAAAFGLKKVGPNKNSASVL
jgi:hypothetical protein